MTKTREAGVVLKGQKRMRCRSPVTRLQRSTDWGATRWSAIIANEAREIGGVGASSEEGDEEMKLSIPLCDP